MDDIFTLILVIIAIVSAVTKAKSKTTPKPRKYDKPAASGDLRAKLKAFFADIQEKLEAQTQQGASGSSQWRQLKRGNKAGGPSADHYDMSVEDLILEDEEPPPEPEIKPRRRSVAVQPQPAKKQPTGEQPDLHPGEPAPAKAALNRAFLRKAVIWSEILGPPKALREFSGER